MATEISRTLQLQTSVVQLSVDNEKKEAKEACEKSDVRIPLRVIVLRMWKMFE